MSAADITHFLREYSRYPLPQNVLAEIVDLTARWGKIVLTAGPEGRLRLGFSDASLAAMARNHKTLSAVLEPLSDALAFVVPPAWRGAVKQVLLKLGHPVDDRAGFTPGRPLAVALRETSAAGAPFTLRAYQRDAVRAFTAGAAGDHAGGHGVVVLPCGAGKTLVAMAAMAELATETLVLVTNVTAARQWIAELCDKTTLTADQIGEYSGDRKEIRPVTVATYQILTKKMTGKFPHFEKLGGHEFGLIVYDEVHLLPAPVFRLTAEIQAKRRLGLTATLIREDGLEGEVFSLIGPKRFDVPWKEIEAQGFIAEATCYELRLPLPPDRRTLYDASEAHLQHQIAASNPAKLEQAARLCADHAGASILVIGAYLEQLAAAAARLRAPLITGETPQREREKLLDGFRSGVIPVLILSRVGNFSIDLPDASVCIQISGTFGSRQEEAQRLGRILRPKRDGRPALFYSLVTRDTVDQRFAMNRQLFLTEQGYRYYIEDIGAPPVVEREATGATILPFVTNRATGTEDE
ncbi:MAG TPA: DNA repair helicase XPB, partial [Polyangia bacterium]|nr:DNA repair helicase XPB [Polyangia bacterium]